MFRDPLGRFPWASGKEIEDANEELIRVLGVQLRSAFGLPLAASRSRVRVG